MRLRNILILFIIISAVFFYFSGEDKRFSVSSREDDSTSEEQVVKEFSKSLETISPELLTSNSDTKKNDPHLVRVPKDNRKLDFYEAGDLLEVMTTNENLEISDFLLSMMTSEALETEEKINLLRDGLPKISAEDRSNLYESIVYASSEPAILREALGRLRKESSAEDLQAFLQRLSIQPLTDEKSEIIGDFEADLEP